MVSPRVGQQANHIGDPLPFGIEHILVVRQNLLDELFGSRRPILGDLNPFLHGFEVVGVDVEMVYGLPSLLGLDEMVPEGNTAFSDTVKWEDSPDEGSSSWRSLQFDWEECRENDEELKL